MNIPKHVMDRAAQELKHLGDACDRFVAGLVSQGKCDAQLAPIWAEKLRHTIAGTIETIYPDLVAANGGVLPIDSSVNPATLEYEWFTIDRGAVMDWIDDEGNIVPGAFVTMKRDTGKHAEFAGGYAYNIFDLERWAFVGMNLPNELRDAMKRAHDEFVEWTWMFGRPEKELYGLCSHPNIPMSTAALNAGATSRLPANKTDDEVLRDFVTLLDTIPQQSVEAHHATKVYMPFSLIRLMRARFIASTATGTVSLWDKLQALYSGDDSGQGKVSFMGLNVCDASRRVNPNTRTDTSNISGDMLIACSGDARDGQFMRCRPLTQRPPVEEDLKVKVLAHANIGGARLVHPLAFHVMVYGTT